MNEPKTKDPDEIEAGIKPRKKSQYMLRLFIAGLTPKSQRAIENLRKICEEHLKNGYELEVVDIFQQPGTAQAEQIVAVPTLIRKLPLPVRKFIGDLSQTEKILVGLEIKSK